MKTKTAREAREYAEEIRAFDRQCRLDEHTDTARAWELLMNVRLFLMRASKEAGK